MAVDGASIVEEAKKHIGLKYVWGGTSLVEGADCSGYLQSVYKKFGITVPRVTYDQINNGSKISMPDLRAGDMVFFDTDRSTGGPDHVGMYIGGGKFIHSPRPGSSVQISSMTDSYYSSRYMAARRPMGVVGAGEDSADADSITTGTRRLEPEELAASYGWSYSFLKSNSELASIFGTAVAETWTADKFKAKVKDTKWWQATSEKVREAQILQATDPATYAAKVQATGMIVRMAANEMGAIVPEGVLSSIGENVMRTGMEDAELRHTLAQYIDFTKEGTLGGQAGQAQVRLTQLARLNGVQMSDQSMKNYAQQIAMGVTTMEQAEQYVRNMAKSMFPVYGEQIDAGENMQDIASPYIEQVSKDLELNPFDVGLDNPLVKRGLNGLTEKGEPHGLTLYEFQNVVRSDPRWLQTNNAREGIMKVGNDVLRNMGMIA